MGIYFIVLLVCRVLTQATLRLRRDRKLLVQFESLELQASIGRANDGTYVMVSLHKIHKLLLSNV